METNNIIDLRRLWRAVKQLKWVYLLSAIVFVSTAVWFVNRSMPKHSIMGEMLIGEESMSDGGALASAKSGAGGMSQMLKTFSVGGFGGAAVDNEVLVLSSHDVLLRTVKSLNLNRLYTAKDENGKKAQLWRESPVLVEAPAEFFDTLSTSFRIDIKLLPGGKADIVATKGFFKKQIAEASGVTLPTLFKTPYGAVQILRGETFDSSPYKNVSVSVYGNDPAAISLGEKLDIDVMTKLSDVIEIDLDYPNAELGKAIVNGVMAEYNAKRLDRIHETAVGSIKYYDERIAETLRQLDSAEQKVANFQLNNSMSAIEAEAKLISGLKAEGQAKLIAAQHTLDYYNTVLKSINNSLDSDILVPVIESMGDSTIVRYNNLILQRRNLRRSATENNETMMHLNEDIATLAGLIRSNADIFINKARNELSIEANITGMAANRLNQYPSIELGYTSLARDKEFQNNLYLFLVQARENAVLKLYTDTDLGYVFQPAYVTKPGLPIKAIVMVIAAFIAAIVGSTMLAMILMIRSQKTRQPMDVAFLGIDKRAITTNGDPEQAARMRTMLMADPVRRVIYTANFCNTNVGVASLISSFESAGLPVSEITADTNSMLLSPETTDIIVKSAETNRFTIVELPQPKDLFMLENAIDCKEAALLICIPSSMRRSTLRHILKGQSPDKIFTFIVN